MTYVGRAEDRQAGAIAAWRRLAGWSDAPAAAAALLGMLAVAEAVWAAVTSSGSLAGYGTSAGEWPFVLVVLIVVSLATTLPLGFLWARPAWAALALFAAALVSLAIFQTLTVAGLIAELAAAYRLGRRGSPLLAAGLALPFLVLALAGSGNSAYSAARIQALLLASLGPAAGLAAAPAGCTARRSSTAPPGRLSRAPCWSTLRAGNAPGSPVSCTTWSPTTSP